MQQWSKNFATYLLGLIILTLGISLTIQSQLGASPFDALLVGLYRTFGLSIGSWEIVVGFTIVVANAIAVKQRPELTALLTSFITGIGIDTWLVIQRPWLEMSQLFGQSLVLILGIVLSGIGIAIYLESSFAPNPMDRSMVILTDKTNWSLGRSRAIISVVLVIIALFFHGDVGVGTLLNALTSGIVIQFARPYVQMIQKKLQTASASVRYDTK
ncbi:MULTISPECIES: YczE/YyaS/YitT family protein [Gracilibacillus]|uniref:YczE/YyaS/YitT family protein n=1 Tax=Gracilibacillus TaxID=74385 RepID=UPI000B059416|nr:MULTISPECIES: YitT family protein [Gracilibacillus]